MSQCTYEIQLKRKKNVDALAVNSQVEVRENGFNTRQTDSSTQSVRAEFYRETRSMEKICYLRK